MAGTFDAKSLALPIRALFSHLHPLTPLSFIGAVALTWSTYGEGFGPILMSSVVCNGTEQNISQCRRSDGSSCIHFQDAGVICKREEKIRGKGRGGGWVGMVNWAWGRGESMYMCSV